MEQQECTCVCVRERERAQERTRTHENHPIHHRTPPTPPRSPRSPHLPCPHAPHFPTPQPHKYLSIWRSTTWRWCRVDSRPAAESASCTVSCSEAAPQDRQVTLGVSHVGLRTLSRAFARSLSLALASSLFEPRTHELEPLVPTNDAASHFLLHDPHSLTKTLILSPRPKASSHASS